MDLAQSGYQPYIEAHLKNFKDNWHHEKRQYRPFVTISREAGAYGNTIAGKLTEYLNSQERRKSCPWTLFEKELLTKVAQEHDLPLEMLSYFPESTVSEIEDALEELFGLHPSQYALVHKVGQTILHLAQLGNCVIVGRGSNIITTSMPHGVHIRLIGSLQMRIEHIMNHMDLDKKKAVEYIKHHDLDRQKYVRKHFDCDIADPKHYDLVINTDNVSVDEAVELIASLVFKIKETGKK